jgi:hypothetical protein
MTAHPWSFPSDRVGRRLYSVREKEDRLVTLALPPFLVGILLLFASQRSAAQS